MAFDDFAGSPSEETTVYSYNQTGQGPYDDFRMGVSTSNLQGILQMPVADGSNKCDLIAVADPVSVKVVVWKATRNGMPPEAPDPKKVLPNHKLLRSTEGAAVPTPNPDGITNSYTMTGEMVFANEEEVKPGSAIKPGASPVSTTPAASNVYGEVLFRGDLLDG